MGKLPPDLDRGRLTVDPLSEQPRELLIPGSDQRVHPAVETLTATFVSPEQDMSALVKEMREQLTKAEDLQMKAKNQYEKLRKERDFHRMHHKRVVQEKNKLIGDLKRVRTHCDPAFAAGTHCILPPRS